jgi:hypothetical protein
VCQVCDLILAFHSLLIAYTGCKERAEENVVQLVETMIEVYDFVEDVENLPQKIKRLENVVVEIARQTLECAIFICEYTGHGFSGMKRCSIFFQS